MYLGLRLRVQCAYALHAMDFRLRVNQQKTRLPGCVHAERMFLLVGTAHVSVKFKLSCAVPLKSKILKPSICQPVASMHLVS